MRSIAAAILLCAALFAPLAASAQGVTHSLTIHIVGNGHVEGDVTCSADCTVSVAEHAILMLDGAPNGPSIWQSWAGCDSPDSWGGTCQVVMDSDRTLTVTFTTAVKYDIVLQGAQVVPYVSTPASGSAHVEYDPTTHWMTYAVSYAGLTGSVTTADMHILGARGENGPSLTPLVPGDPTSGELGLTPSGESLLLSGQFYIDVHTTAHPDGEIRGQIDNLGAVALEALDVTLSGDGAGTVFATTEAGTVIDCGTDCSELVPQGKAVTLTASPAPGSAFAGWSGACTGSTSCAFTMDGAKPVDARFVVASTIPRLGNISTRGMAMTGANVLIGGFVIGGSTSKTVAITATGPSLVPFGIANPLANPTLTLVRQSDHAVIAANDDWQADANAAQLLASGFAPTDPLESGLYVTLPPGAYTAIVSGAGDATGVSVVGVFEVDHPEIPLVNISTRGFVQLGNNVMIGGFIIDGSAPRTVAITATGPSLAAFGITNPLVNPKLTLVRQSDQAVIAANDDWQSDANAAQLQASGFAPSDPLEAGLLVTLAPGAYTAIVSGVGNTMGVSVVGVFTVP